ncbi:EAL domain-containing protein [Peribacillus sp. SCS-37]|uniref:EAL domain-containing protein n=1 Tax=Paraperibacillus esterisolvens TaxID=3115296 RepID=UPI0039066854
MNDLSVFMITFELFHYKFVLMTMILSILSCVLGLEMSRRMKGNPSIKLLAGGAFLMAVTFWLTHFFISYSIDLNFSTTNFPLYSFTNFIFCFIGSLVALKMTQFRLINGRFFILGSLVIAISILGADTLGFLVLFYDSLDLKPMFIFMAFILILGTSFSIFRFLNQFTNEDNYQLLNKWKYIGCVAAGTALSGIPYIVIVSILELEEKSAFSPEMMFPFIYVMLANVLLTLVPDIFGDKILVKNIESYRSMFNHNPDAVFSVDLKGQILNVNKEAERLTGIKTDKLIGAVIQDFFPGDRGEKIRNYLSDVSKGNVTHIDAQISLRDGLKKDVRITAVKTVVENNIVGAYGIVKDITDVKRAENQVRFMAYHDELTSLPNRRMIKKVMSETADKQTPFHIMLMDFDRFKRINDTFGHAFGDKLLIEVGNKLREVIGDKGTAARLGGDEYLIITTEYTDSLADDVIHAFRTPLVIGGYEVLLTASMGVASFPQDTRDIDELYKFADIAMYYSKENGANGYSLYTKEMADKQIDKLDIENDLAGAIQNGDLMLYFQPKYNTASGEMIGSEVLLRWNHKEKGFIPPAVFIPIAEESGLIVRLERFVFTEVCKLLAEWRSQDKNMQRVSINVSLISILQEGFLAFIMETLESHELEGSLIELEITERIVMENEEEVNCTLQRLREYGLVISIDDFGTGYSSLSYLDKLHVDILKIDRSFINNIQNSKEVVTAIIFLAKSLNLKVIAEGVETNDQVELLRLLGCEEAQGYYYSPPVPVIQFEEEHMDPASAKV